MFKAKLCICHEGCWATAITTAIPVRFLLHNTASIEPQVTSDILYTQADVSKQKAIEKFLAQQPNVEYQVLERNDTQIFILVITAGNSTIIEKLTKNKAILLEPVVLEKGYEFWTIGAPSRAHVMHIVQDIPCCELKGLSEYSLEQHLLTGKQKEAVATAYAQGYYQWPRKVDTKQLAALSGIAKSTYVEHLRKAEIKIIKQFLAAPVR